MANSKFEYVRHFELADNVLPNTWIVVRVDGRGFHRFLKLMTLQNPMTEELSILPIAVLLNFIIPKTSNLYKRRSSKISSTIVSLFTSNYVMRWAEYFGQDKLHYAPCFDSRTVCYPNNKTLRDYLSWRQADCHINNLFNTTFWALVQKGGMTQIEAEDHLKGSFSKDKNEILFTQFNINYNKIDPIYKKGSTIIRRKTEVTSISPRNGEEVKRIKLVPTAVYDDIIGPEFWDAHPELLAEK
ncbi:unnamed protein product [Mucor hiemalis]